MKSNSSMFGFTKVANSLILGKSLHNPLNKVSNEYEIFTRFQAYYNYPTIKSSLQLDNGNCRYELFPLITKKI